MENYKKNCLKSPFITSFTICFSFLILIYCSNKKKYYQNSSELLFMNAVIDSIGEGYSYLAEHNTCSVMLEDTTSIFTDTFFTELDKPVFFAQIKTKVKKRWKAKEIKRIPIIKKRKLDQLFSHDTESGWEVFRSKYGKGFLMCSYPIFNIKRNMCIIEVHYFCGSKCGGGSVSLYKKISKKWILVKNYTEWVT